MAESEGFEQCGSDAFDVAPVEAELLDAADSLATTARHALRVSRSPGNIAGAERHDARRRLEDALYDSLPQLIDVAPR